jgi:hypothetical protein
MSVSKPDHIPPQAKQPNITARPSGVRDEYARELTDESGSQDPDELGEHALLDAMQIERSRSDAGMSLLEGAASDAALSGPNYDPEGSIWEQTIGVSLDEGGLDASRGDPLVTDPDEELTEPLSDHELNLKRSTIREASLFDSEGDEGDETTEPVVETDNDSPEHLTPAEWEREQVEATRKRSATKARPRATTAAAAQPKAKAKLKPKPKAKARAKTAAAGTPSARAAKASAAAKGAKQSPKRGKAVKAKASRGAKPQKKVASSATRAGKAKARTTKSAAATRAAPAKKRASKKVARGPAKRGRSKRK